MRTHESYVNYAVGIVDLHHQSVGVALDVKDYSIVAHDTRVAILPFDFIRRIPILLFDYTIPSKQRILGVRVTLPALPECFLGDNPHVNLNLNLILELLPYRGARVAGAIG